MKHRPKPSSLEAMRRSEVESFVDETYRDAAWHIWDIAQDGDTWRVEVISSEGYSGSADKFELDGLHLARAVHGLVFVPDSALTSDMDCEYQEQGINDIFYAPGLGEEKADMLLSFIVGYLYDEEEERPVPHSIDLRSVRDPHLRKLLKDTERGARPA